MMSPWKRVALRSLAAMIIIASLVAWVVLARRMAEQRRIHADLSQRYELIAMRVRAVQTQVDLQNRLLIIQDDVVRKMLEGNDIVVDVRHKNKH